MRKFILSRKEHRKHLMVSAKLHALVCLYAKENDITITEATHILLGKGLAQVYGFSNEEISSIEPTK